MPGSSILPVLRSRVESLEFLSGSPAFYPFSAQLLDRVFTQPEFARPLEQISLEFKHLLDGFRAQQEAFRQEASPLLGRFWELFPERRDDNVQRAGEHGLPTLAYYGSLKRAENILAGQDLYALRQRLEPAKFGDDRTPVGALL
ncbi:hypothetical protein DAETH_38590 (plasmid) [Deinococcus aetherius]|uniref:Uncharacterized protein n=1 Tax=Deinococcus aetherius TaxID=200252 RepID=A0ABM8AJL2_9DEIO|nr:hypothetical protein [Deinococcus aetherius]BDP43890.1 hypothetical protein DAETH_38590 [Deinococcus aetherius]